MKILAIGAHPDDIEYGCGGTLLNWAAKGNKIHLIVLTRGEASGDPDVRQKEQEKSARLMKAGLFQGSFRDSRLVLDRNLIESIEKTMSIVKPDIIFAHYFNDSHQDHRYVSQAVITATRHHRKVLFYEVPTTIDFMPTVFVDIKNVMPRKIQLLKVHKSQMYATKPGKFNILENARAGAIFRGFQDRVKYAEGFVPLRYSLMKNGRN